MALPYFFGAYILLSMVSIVDTSNIVKDWTMTAAVVCGLYAFLIRRSESFTVTKEQVIHKKGIFSTQTEFLEMYRILDFKMKKPFLMRPLGAIIVILTTSVKNKRIVTLKGIPNSDIAFKLRDLVELQRKKKNVYVTE